jgi:YVTN family beta-propeller protein
MSTAGALACAGDHSATGGPPAASPSVSVAGVALRRVPTPIVRECQAVQRAAAGPILCPTSLPRPLQADSGSAQAPPVLSAVPVIGVHRRPVGLEFGYGAETGARRLNTPRRLLHFVVQQADLPLPAGLHAARLGGKRGRIVGPAKTSGPSQTYFPNHLRFFWTERGSRYAATLHYFGPRTRRLLGALIARLRPATSLRGGRGLAPSRSISLGVGGPTSLASRGATIWVAAQGVPFYDRGSFLLRIDVNAGRQLGRPIALARTIIGPPGVTSDGSIWVAQFGAGPKDAIRALDPTTGRLEARISAPPHVVSLTSAGGYLWTVELGTLRSDRHPRGSLARIDPVTRLIDARVRVGKAPAAVAAGFGSVWVTNNLDDTVSQIDMRSMRVAQTTRVGRAPVGVATGAGSIWVANTGSNTVSRIHSGTARVSRTIHVGRRPRAIVVGAGAVWVANELDDSVSKIDPATNRVTETIPVGAGPSSLALAAGSVWVANNHDGTLSRIDSGEEAKELNLPSMGLPRPAGVQGRMGHQTRAAP